MKNVEESRDGLKRILRRYIDCKKRKRQLEERLKSIQVEMSMPIGGVSYSQTPHSVTNKIGAGAAGFTIKMAEIEDRIIKQKDDMEKAMISVMDMMNYLGEETVERRILEYRYIDGKEWRDIEKLEHMTRQAANSYLNAGLDKLLTFKRIRMIAEKN